MDHSRIVETAYKIKEDALKNAITFHDSMKELYTNQKRSFFRPSCWGLIGFAV
jgi:hypothetical protein